MPTALADVLMAVHAALRARAKSKTNAANAADAAESKREPQAATVALLALHALDPMVAGPIAWSIRGLLQQMANEARVAFLRRHPVSQTYLVASRVKVQPAKPLSAPWYQVDSTRLGSEAPTVDALARFLSTEYRRINPFEFEGLVRDVARSVNSASGSKAPDDSRRIAVGLDDAHVALARAADRVIDETMAVLPFDTMVIAASEGVGNDEDSAPGIAARPDLANADACLPLIERLFVTGRGDWLEAFLIARVGEQKCVAAIPLLAAIAVARASAVQQPALDALQSISGASGHAVRDALLAALLHLIDEGGLHWDASHGAVHVRRVLMTLLAIDAARDDRDPLGLLNPLFLQSRCATAAGAFVAREALSALQGSFLGHGHAVTNLLVGHGARHATLVNDPRWLSILVPLLANRRMALPAKLVLDSLDPTQVQAALAAEATRAKASPSVPPVPSVDARATPTGAHGASGRWLARYEKGEHHEVWRELASLGELAGDAKLAPAVQAVADATMARVGRNLALLITRLRKAKVPLQATAKILGKPATAAEIEKLEKIAKRPLPALLRSFYAIIGGVDFSKALDLQGFVPPRMGLLRGDALVLQSLKYPAKRFEAEQRDWKGIPDALLPLPALYLAPDPKLRLDLRAADDEPTYVDISRTVADPAIVGAHVGRDAHDANTANTANTGHVGHADHEATLLGYLRASLASAGFLGADRDAVAPLVKGLEPF